jgi:hypothetical protein
MEKKEPRELAKNAMELADPSVLDSSKFSTILNVSPEAGHVCENKMVNLGDRENPKFAKYVPISIIQRKLDAVFPTWSTKDFRTEVIVNEITGSLTLEVQHPVSGERITRIGAAAVPIMQDKGAKIDDISAKKKTALKLNYPALLSLCLSNAASTLGKWFGRDLNRDIVSGQMKDLAATLSGVDKQMVAQAKKLLQTADFPEQTKLELEMELENAPENIGNIFKYIKEKQI